MLFGAHIFGGLPLIPFSFLLLTAAVTDVTSYRIPNWIPLSLVSFFIILAAISPEPVAWGSHLGAGLLSFAVGALLFVFRPLISAGDVKLIAAASLWIGLPGLAVYLLLVSVCGGILGIGLWAIREIVARAGPRLAKEHAAFSLPRVLVRHAEVPYGLAIVTAILIVYLKTPMFFAS